MSKIFKKSCSLVLAVALLLSMAVVNVLAGDSASTGLTVEQIEGNILTDGSFENGASGWSAENATVTKTMDPTYGSTVGAGLVTRTAESGYIHQTVSVRKYTWYTYSVVVKMATGTANAKITLDYDTDTWNTDATQEILSENTEVNADSWTELKGFFVRVNESSAQTEDTDVADYFLPAKVSLVVSGSADYYVDEFKIVALEGMYNGDFTDGTAGWSIGSTATLGVVDGSEALGTETVGKKVMHVTNGKDKFLQTAVCVEKDVVYEISAKIKPVVGVDGAGYIRIRNSKAAMTNSTQDGSANYLGQVNLDATGKWTTLKAKFKYTGTNPYLYFDIRFMPSVVTEYYMTDFEMKKETNLMDNPYYQSYSYDGSAVTWTYRSSGNASGEPTVGDWIAGGTATGEAISEADAIGTYDNSGSRLKFQPSTTSTTYGGNSIRQEVVLEKGRKYDISLWIKGENIAENPRTYVLRTRNSDSTAVQSNNYMLPTGSDQQAIPTEWTKIDIKGYEFSIPDGYTKSELGLTADTAGTTDHAIYLQDFSVTPVYEAPVIESVALGDVATGLALSAPVITTKESPDDYSYRYRYILYDTQNATDGEVALSGHTTVGGTPSSYTVQSDWKNKYVALEVTPVSDKGVWGNSFTTEKVRVEESYSIEPATGNGYTGTITAGGTVAASVTVKNNDATNTLPVAVIIAYFEDERLIAANIEEESVAQGTPHEFTPSVTLPATLGSNPSVKVFVWKGNDGETFLMQPLTTAYPKQ